MEEKKLLRDWLTILYSSLKSTNKEIRDLENNKVSDEQLNRLQLNRLNLWLSEGELEPEIKEDMEYSRDYVERIPSENEKRLKSLVLDKKRDLFMIGKIEKELRD